MRVAGWVRLTLLAGGIAILSGGAAHAAGPTDSFVYDLHVEYRTPSGQSIATDVQTLHTVPAAVDADHDPKTGLAGADLIVQTTVDAGRVTLRVTKQVGAPATMPILITATFSDPRRDLPFFSTGSQRFRFGYDTLDSTAPQNFDATASLAGAGRIASFTLDAHAAAPGPRLALVGEAFTPDASGAPTNPVSARLALSPVPGLLHVGVLSGDGSLAGPVPQQSIDLRSDTPCVATFRLDETTGPLTRHLDGVVDKLPATLSLARAGGAGATQSWSYRASARVGLAEISSSETLSGATIRSAALHIEDAPTSATLTQDSATHAVLDTDAPIGLVRAGIATAGPPVYRADAAYLNAVRLGDYSSLAFQLRGLTSPAEIDAADPFVVAASMSPGPFHVAAVDGARVVDAWIRDLPGTFRIQGSAAQRSIDVSASAAIGELTFDAGDPAGIGGRATAMHVLLRGIPASFGLRMPDGNEPVSFDAGGGTLGLIEAQLTSGPDDRIEASKDGLLVEDLTDRFVVFARMTGLRRASIGAGALPSASLRTTGGRPFVADIRIPSAAGGLATALTSISALPSELDATFTSATSFSYAASAPVATITLDASDAAGLAGRATHARVALSSLPVALDAAIAEDGTASVDAHGGSLGLIEAQLTSGPDERLAAGDDGVLIRDLPDRFVAFVRATGVRAITLGAGTLPVLSAQTGGGRPLVLDVQAPSQGVAGTATALARITVLPASLSLGFTGPTSFAYSASAPVASITLDATDPAGIAGRATSAHVAIASVPAAFDANVSTDGSLTLDAHGSSVGSFDAQLTSGPDDRIATGRDGILLEDLPDRFVVHARLTGLRSASIGAGALPVLSLATNGGMPLTLDVRGQGAAGATSTLVSVDTLPATLTMQFAGASSFSYTASAPVASITMDATDPAGLAGRATTAHLLMQDLPVRLDATFAADGTVTANAFGGTAGLLQLQLTSGPDDRVPAGLDGVLLEDLADRYVVYARLTALRSVSAKAPNISIDSTGGKVLSIDTQQLDPATGKVEYLRVTLDHLVPGVTITQVEIPTGSRMIYDASAATSSLTMDSNAGDRWNLHTELSNPLPAHFDICSATDGACTGATAANRRYAPNAGSQSILASEPVTINLFDCVRPVNATCSTSTATKFTQATNLRVRRFEFDSGSTSDASSGYIFENTTDHSAPGCATAPQSSDAGACHYRASGSIKSRDTAAGTGFEQSMGSNFWADNRFGGWNAFLFGCCKSNYINCDGLALSVWAFGIKTGVSGFLC